ncbi:succinate dehydrogenase, cytochrome b556 subunit [Sphingomonas canadensis]|uniref:succinate dehydrogenase, cytochrome b556 subunit n=1 Tax=Sphingomonas canadensis TaxID=1219257 RepID=UPI0022300694|nr:succinate dehydrogenase, cytochrome b556 subunit [Sphingomonas canadensis]MCW3835314.1 succinate dehydrogenase, cytochrome b556 subunit [Sphingomonas canadensis]
MANVRNEKRPLSPHLTAYKWGPHMAVSIIHRATGAALGIGGVLLLLWWLAALAAGGPAYALFLDVFTVEAGGLNIAGWIAGVGLTWVLFQHMGSGVRHLFLDQGANFELKGNRNTALATFVFSVVATIGFWVFILEKSNG